MFDATVEAYSDAILATDRDMALQVVNQAVAMGVSAEDIVFKVVVPSIEKMIVAISRLESVSLAQHFLASQIAAEVVEEMLPRFKVQPERLGTIVIGTSAGDFHGLGKRIVSGCLKAKMIDVVDLGLNVAPERFVDAALEHNAQVIGISSMMVHTARGDNGCRKVRQILMERALEGKIKVVVGGAPYRFDDQLYHQVGADAWADNAVEAGPVIARLIAEVTT